jgi:hypothetical protein
MGMIRTKLTGYMIMMYEWIQEHETIAVAAGVLIPYLMLMAVAYVIDWG